MLIAVVMESRNVLGSERLRPKGLCRKDRFRRGTLDRRRNHDDGDLLPLLHQADRP